MNISIYRLCTKYLHTDGHAHHSAAHQLDVVAARYRAVWSSLMASVLSRVVGCQDSAGFAVWFSTTWRRVVLASLQPLQHQQFVSQLAHVGLSADFAPAPHQSPAHSHTAGT